MENRRLVKISRFLSKHLRHRPDRLGLELARGGWVGVDALLVACAAHGFPVTREELEEVVARSDKQRFSFDAPGERIRANQGHSVDVDLELEAAVPPEVLYHGTTGRFLDAILKEGLQKRNRHHVHLSLDVPTALRVGARRGRPVVLAVRAREMHDQGHAFFVSANGVWLTDHVPPEFVEVHGAGDGARTGEA